MNRVFLAVVLSVVMMLAGCAGGPNVGVAEADRQGTVDGASGGATSGTASGDSGSDDEFEVFDFSQPGRYEYDIYVADEGEGRVVWDIQSVDGETVTVFVDYQLGTDSYQSTVTGTPDDIRGQMMMTPAGSFVILGLFSPYYGYYEGRELRVGNQWSYAADGESMRFDITGTDTVGGVDCYTSELRINGDVFHEACFSPDLGLAPYTAYYEDNGDVSFSMELISYEAR